MKEGKEREKEKEREREIYIFTFHSTEVVNINKMKPAIKI